MGFEANAIKFLLLAKKENILLGKTLTLGRQSYQLDKKELLSILPKYGFTQNEVEELFDQDNTYVEPFLKAIGATNVDSMDASEYEHATLIHDLNNPITEGLKGKYDTIIDAGTLEHIFNFPTAITNCMEMLKVGGNFIAITVTNNFSGHGFYQFSPELFFRILSPENGFETKKMYLAVSGPGNYWYEIPDPKEIKSRVLLENSKQSFLLIHATRTAQKPIFKSIPQQSDYEHLAWEGKNQFRSKKASLVSKLIFFIPNHLKKRIRSKFRIIDPIAWHSFLSNTGSGKKSDFKKIKNL
jgi:hypothetical protein